MTTYLKLFPNANLAIRRNEMLHYIENRDYGYCVLHKQILVFALENKTVNSIFYGFRRTILSFVRLVVLYKRASILETILSSSSASRKSLFRIVLLILF